MGPAATRRDFLKAVGAGVAAASLGGEARGGTDAHGARAASPERLRVDPTPRFELSPWLYMQFMEPLGVTDSSVAAAWDALRNCWRPDVVAATRELAPPLIRWGGCFSSYYRWREGVGPRDRRRPMHNLLWGGVETNQVGTHEFVDFCRQVGAEPLFCVNFGSDGRRAWMHTPDGDVRSAGPEEAAAWVDYCNRPDHAERSAHGAPEPFKLRLWQVGNETSYDENGFDLETAARQTVAFAQAMRAADPEIELIGWGDSGWARRMLEVAGEHMQYLAFHHHFDSGLPDSPLRGVEYRRDPERTWQHLMHARESLEARLQALRGELGGAPVKLAMTEGHFALPGRNRCEVLSTWAAGVANARLLNVQARHGDLLKIATLADFCGTRWQVNAVMIPTPHGQAFLMPVARVMRLFGRHVGRQAVGVPQAPADLDVTASRTEQRVYLHVVNTHRTRAIAAEIAVDQAELAGGRVYTLAADPMYEVLEHDPDVLQPQAAPLAADGRCVFPAAAVSVVELELRGERRASA